MDEREAVAPSPSNRQVDERETQDAQRAIAQGEATPHGVRSTGLLVLSVLAVVYTLSLGKEVILPIVLALMLKLLLQPVMRFVTERLRFPDALAAVLLIVAVFGAIAAVAFTISFPASTWIQKAPESLHLLREKLAVLRQPIDFVQERLRELESITSASQTSGAETVTIKQPSGLPSYLATSTATLLSRFLTTLILLFFLLAAGDRLLRGLVEVLPRFSDKREAVAIATEIERNITGYLVTITLMNAAVGLATGFAMWACGLGDPILWGSAAFLLNFVPILGPLCGVGMFLVAGILAFDSPWTALLPAGLYLLIHIAEGETITPMLLAKRFTLNPVLVIVSLFFWHTLWGIPGALLAVPLLAMFKILCDHVRSLKPVGHLIGS